MLEDLAEFLKPREERISLGKVKLIVRELDGTADNSILKEDQDRSWRILVRCVFREDSGDQAFTDADIPALKRKSPQRTMPLISAVTRVNGFGIEDEAKNSDAAQG
jgi:hypothetical protein